ncbi:EamA family transporter [Solimicrobium silvestre]|uniref:Putative permease DMT superfamily n=1 Tax=Solimicrobium silvestre TaxID=2099400 RepID=A0A2S9GT84_9BURK|nr:EamA family transporter [Solimicrobium silvestre]PRC90927.1 putative permease DMT superfamily [Solimicrobium silvestre]
MNSTTQLSTTRLSPLVLLCLVATWFIWGSMYLAIKWALVSFPPFYQMGTQFIVAGILLAMFAKWRGANWPEPSQWVGGSILGALLLLGGYGFTALAETRVGSGLVVAFSAVVPSMVALAEWPYGARPGMRRGIGIVVGLIGIFLLTQGSGFSASTSGLLFMFIACVTWSIGSVWAVYGLPGGISLKIAPGFMGHASQMLIGGVMLLLVSFAVGEVPVWPPEPMALASWSYLMVAGSLVGYTAYMLLLERTSPTLASSYTYVNPIVALVLGTVLGGELVTSFEWVAVAVVLIGVILLMWKQRS